MPCCSLNHSLTQILPADPKLSPIQGHTLHLVVTPPPSCVSHGFDIFETPVILGLALNLGLADASLWFAQVGSVGRKAWEVPSCLPEQPWTTFRSRLRALTLLKPRVRAGRGPGARLPPGLKLHWAAGAFRPGSTDRPRLGG